MRKGFVLFSRILFLFVFVLSLVPFQSAAAAAVLTIEPITWNVIGLDSNNVNTGPNNFPVGARVCNTGDATANNVVVDFVWDDGLDDFNGNAYINLRGSSLSVINFSSITAGTCEDAYFEVTITRNAAAYNQTRDYHITADSDETTLVSTPTPREIYVEYLISQNRNSTLDVQLDGNSVAPGGTMSLVVGETYTITLVAKTATQGYEQIESFINFPNTIFQVLSVDTTYSAESSGSMVPPYDTLYGDACVWQNDPNSPQYRDCLSTGKAGGNITVEYEVTIISGGGTSGILNTLIYDFSGSSYHYNADYSVGGRIYSIVDPALVDISKNFNPDPTNAGGTSVLTFTLTNGNASSVSDVNFVDDLPNTPGVMAVANPPNASTSGCGTPTFSPTAGATTLTFSNGTIAANGTCTVSVNVTVPATGVYDNTSNNLFVGTVDTGNSANDTLTVNTTPPPPACVAGLPMATWDFSNATTVGDELAPPPSSSSVTASASAGAGTVDTRFLINTNAGNNQVGGSRSWEMDNVSTADALNTANNEYYEFAIDTTGFESVTISFWAKRTVQGPQDAQLYYGLTGATASNVYAITTDYQEFTTTLNSGLNSNGITLFRIYAYDANNTNNGHSIYVDGVTFTGCGTPQHPTLTKSFSPDPVAVGGTSTLTFTVDNPNPTIALSGVAFTDTLPSGVTVVTSGPTAVCGGSLSTTAPSTITFTGGSLAANTSCNIPVPVTVTTAGPHTNISGFISSTQSGTNTTPTGYATDTITAILPPTISKLFAPNPILANGISTLTFVIENPNNDQPLSGVAFTDTFPIAPAAMTVASPLTTSNTCGGTLADNLGGALGTGDAGIQLTGGSIPAGETCVVSVNVTAPTNGNYVNTSGAVTTIINGSPVGTDTADDTLLVNAPNPGIAILKQVGLTNNPNGAWSSFLPVPVGTNVYYKITIENTGDVPLSPVSVNDPDVSTAGCTWPVSLLVADADDDDHIAICILGPVSAVAGLHDNTATASGTYSGNDYTDTSTATYATPGLTLTKSAAETYFTAAGNTLFYTYVVMNTGFVPLLGPVTVADDKTTVSCPAVSTVGDNDNYLDPGESLTCTATYTIVAGDVTAGFVTNTAQASVGGVASNEDDVTVPRQLPDLTITKTNNTSDTGTVGVEFNWILTVNNTGPLAATFTDGQTLLSDPLPAGATYGSPTAGGFTGVTNSGNISCSIDGSNVLTCVANGADVTIGATTGSFTVTIPVTPTAGGNLVNTATVDPNNNVTESNETNNTGTNTVFVANPELTMTKSIVSGNPYAAVNDVINYQFVVENTGNVSLAGPVTVNDDQTTDESCPAVNTVGNLDGNLDPGESITCTASYTVTLADLNNGSVTNIADATADGTTSNTDTQTANALTVPTITKAFTVGSIVSGGNTNLTVTIGNTNTSAITLTAALTDSFPTGMTIGTAGNTGTCTGVTATAAAGSFTIANGTSIPAGGCTVIVNVTSSTAGAAVNTIAAGALQTSAGNNADPAEATLNVYIPPTVTKSFGAASIIVGNSTTMTLTLTNPGTNPGTLTTVQVDDTFPAGLTLADVIFTVTPAACGAVTNTSGNPSAAGDDNVRFMAASLAAGSSCEVVMNVTIDTAGPFSNTTNAVTAGGPVPLTGGTANASLGGIFDPPSAIKTFSEVGLPQLEFRMVWINSGNAAAIDVQVTDDIPAGTTYVANSITCEPRGSSSNAAVASSPLSATAVPFSYCGFDAANNRIQWQGNIGPDDGNLTEDTAANEVVITFRVTVNDGVNQVLNQGSSRTDVNDDGSFDDETVLGTSIVISNQVVWNRGTSAGGGGGGGGGTVDPSVTLPFLIPVTGFAPGLTTVLPEQPASKVYAATDVWVEIPGLGISLPIVGVPISAGEWNVSWLGDQAGWLEGTAFPSWKGNSAITGHVTLPNGKAGPFANLEKLKWGDRIVVHAYGYVYVYQVRENKVIAPNDTSVLKHEEDAWLTLLTCKNYNESTGKYANRVSVRAVLISVQKEPAKSIPFGAR